MRAASGGDSEFKVPPVETTRAPDQLRLQPAVFADGESVRLTQVYGAQLAQAPLDYASLEASLGPAPQTRGPRFDVSQARFFNLISERLKLTPSQEEQLQSSGAISLHLPHQPTMGSVYAALWQADLPVFITTDSILHAWHKTYDSTLQRMEVTQFTAAYRDLLEGIATAMKHELARPSPKLMAAAMRIDLYVSVARTLLPEQPEQYVEQSLPNSLAPPSVAPLLANKDDVTTIVEAAYNQETLDVPVFGTVDFTQFKPRGHYTRTDALARYFRAVMWMGRPDTGFPLQSRETARIALLLGLLADHSGKTAAFAKAQRAIDYFVGTSNGLPLMAVVEVLRKNNVKTLAELEDDARMAALTQELYAAVPGSRITSQAVPSQGHDTPPPVVFQLSNQRFTLDSFVHQKVSFDRIQGRMMVDGLDVFAAMGNAEATRLLRPELESFDFSREMYALRQTIAGLPEGYWQQNIYTRWFDALRTLDDVPTGRFVPDLFRHQVWQRKQLVNQLASWAELRRDTILYVAQGYASIICEFPDVYLEPYPPFYDRMHDMALEAQAKLDDKYAFRGFIEVMGQLSDIAKRQLNDDTRNLRDQEFLKMLVKLRTLDGGCGGPTREWTGWYRTLYPGGELFDFEPVVADVFTDPNSGAVLNVATTGPELMVVAMQTQSGPTVFAGPVSGYRQFVGGRMTDDEWKAQLLAGKAPVPPTWNTLQAGKGATPSPHP